MQEKTKDNIDTGIVTLGAVAFAVGLVIDVARGGHPAWFVFDAVMFALCSAHLVDRFALAGKTSQGIVTVAVGILGGVVLVGSFTFFAVTADNLLQVALAVFVALLGLFMAVPPIRKIRVRRIPNPKR